jgi:hypothetical protein
MAAVWTASAPSSSVAVRYAGSYGASGSSVFIEAGRIGGKRAVLTKLSSDGGNYAGTETISAATFGFKEIHGALILADDESAGRPGAAGVLALDTSTAARKAAPVVVLRVAAAAAHAAAATTDYTFHVILLGV